MKPCIMVPYEIMKGFVIFWCICSMTVLSLFYGYHLVTKTFWILNDIKNVYLMKKLFKTPNKEKEM